MTVAPRGVARHRHFGAAATGLALFLFGVMGRSAHSVQREISGWGQGGSRWRTLGRWVDSAASRRLFPVPAGRLDKLERREIAAFVARSVQALAPGSAGDELERMFAASEQAA